MTGAAAAAGAGLQMVLFQVCVYVCVCVDRCAVTSHDSFGAAVVLETSNRDRLFPDHIS